MQLYSGGKCPKYSSRQKLTWREGEYDTAVDKINFEGEEYDTAAE